MQVEITHGGDCEWRTVYTRTLTVRNRPGCVKKHRGGGWVRKKGNTCYGTHIRRRRPLESVPGDTCHRVFISDLTSHFDWSDQKCHDKIVNVGIFPAGRCNAGKTKEENHWATEINFWSRKQSHPTWDANEAAIYSLSALIRSFERNASIRWMGQRCYSPTHLLHVKTPGASTTTTTTLITDSQLPEVIMPRRRGPIHIVRLRALTENNMTSYT